MKALFLSFVVLLLTGCSVFGDSGVEIAPYNVLDRVAAANIEVRNYPAMVLVSAPMREGTRNGAFGRLFDYISGANVDSKDVAMTAPVFMDEDPKGTKIPMTAPVFMDDEGKERMMSFVMPADFTLQDTPVPTDPNVSVRALEDYQVAVITFNGRLSDFNIQKHRSILEDWVESSDYVAVGPVKSAGYNPPFTLPHLRRNEILIPVEKK